VAYNFILLSSDDEDIIEEFNRKERRFKQHINLNNVQWARCCL